MEYLTSGQMARLNGVTEKALHVYQSKGILLPAKINEDTGYRYYTIDQSSTLDMILQLQTIGFSLDEIKNILDTGNMAALEDALGTHLEGILARQHELDIARSIAEDMIETCGTLARKPICNQILIENLPPRQVLTFAVPDRDPQDTSPLSVKWEFTLRYVKQQIIERGYPLSLFRKVGCMNSKERLLAGNLDVDRAFVFVRASCGEAFEASETLPAGQCLVQYYEYGDDSDGTDFERILLREMMDYADEKGFRVVGDYYGEIIAETPAFHYERRTTFYKLHIPIGFP